MAVEKYEHKVITHITSHCCSSFIIQFGNADCACSHCGQRVTYLGAPEPRERERGE